MCDLEGCSAEQNNSGSFLASESPRLPRIASLDPVFEGLDLEDDGLNLEGDVGFGCVHAPPEIMFAPELLSGCSTSTVFSIDAPQAVLIRQGAGGASIAARMCECSATCVIGRLQSDRAACMDLAVGRLSRTGTQTTVKGGRA